MTPVMPKQQMQRRQMFTAEATAIVTLGGYGHYDPATHPGKWQFPSFGVTHGLVSRMSVTELYTAQWNEAENVQTWPG